MFVISREEIDYLSIVYCSLFIREFISLNNDMKISRINLSLAAIFGVSNALCHENNNFLDSGPHDGFYRT